MTQLKVNTISHQTNDTPVIFNDPINLNNLSSDPSTGISSAGDIYYNTTLNKIKFFNGTSWGVM
tara:strand:- start:239 stop:430 length:192 start_codon:yes stop_codon:yes gene_type:complete